MGNYYTPVFNALYKKNYILGVSQKLFAFELASIGISVFIIKLYFLAIFFVVLHITVAIINKKEPYWIEIIKFLLKIGDEKDAILP